MSEYFGKYRAFVVNNSDPKNQGRVQVKVPYISGNSVLGWCLPCVSVASKNKGDFNIPEVDSFVWVEFEHGDIRFPIYTGGIYGDNSVPITDTSKRLISWKNCSITMSENLIELKCGNNIVKITPDEIIVDDLTSTGNISASGTVTGSNI